MLIVERGCIEARIALLVLRVAEEKGLADEETSRWHFLASAYGAIES